MSLGGRLRTILMERKPRRMNRFRISTVISLQELIRRSRDVRQGYPRVFGGLEIQPLDEIFKSSAKFPDIQDGLDIAKGSFRFNLYTRLDRSRAAFDTRWVDVRFQEINVENRKEA